MDKPSFCVVGAGSWGTALSLLIANNGFPTVLVGRDEKAILSMQHARCNERYLPNQFFPDNFTVSCELIAACQSADEILIVAPSHSFRSLILALKPLLQKKKKIVWATKGFEATSGQLLHELVFEIVGNDIACAVISGPTFATELALKMPTALTVASNDEKFAQLLASQLGNSYLRAYTSSDMTGVAVGGAVKNILAIAAGIADGLGFGANARAALITRGLNEIMRLGVHLGGKKETLMGLTGLGDLILTCTDDQSRNRRLGLALGKGLPLSVATSEIDQVIEGVSSAQVVFDLADRLNIEMPIINQVYRILYKGVQPAKAVSQLFAREQKPEA